MHLYLAVKVLVQQKKAGPGSAYTESLVAGLAQVQSQDTLLGLHIESFNSWEQATDFGSRLTCPMMHTAGNVATEDVVYMLSGFGVQHGVDLERLVDVSAFICRALGQEPSARVSRAMLAARQRSEKELLSA